MYFGRTAYCSQATRVWAGATLKDYLKMLDSSPFFAPWPPKPWQRQHLPFASHPVSALQVADFYAPAKNGVDPKWSGWVYVKVDIWNGLCKVGYTEGPIAGRLIETGNPHLALHAAFCVPWGGNDWAEWAEDHCHNRLGRHNMVLHLMSGRPSEFFPGPVEHITELVARAMKEFYDHLWGMLDQWIDVDTMRYEPAYRPEVIRLMSDMSAPYWARRFSRLPPFGS